MLKHLLAFFVGLAFCAPALANWTGKDATPTTITFYNPGVCTAVVCVPVAQLTDGTNQVTLTTAGADGVSNTLTGVPTYARMLQYNGTTWDRWQGAVKAASGAFASGSIASGAMVDLGSQADAACGTDTGTCSAIALIKRGNQTATSTATAVQAAIPAGTNTIGTTGQLPYPVGAVPYTATATGTTGATTATLAGASSVTTYLCGFSIRANATAAATGNATVTGVITATLNFTQWTAPNASGLGVTEMIFAPCIPASGTNQSVAVVSAAPGTGGVVSVTAWGYKL